MIDTSTGLPAQLRTAIAAHADAGRVAFVDHTDGTVGYAEFGRLVDAHAGAAHAAGVRRGDVVGIAGTKSVETVATFFGVLQAGGCPCFLEPRLEDDGVVQRLTIVGMRKLVDPEGTLPAATLSAAGIEVLRVDGTADAYLDDTVPGDDRAMMLFTSGSTGQPKGVLLSHTNMATNAAGVWQHTRVTPDDRLLHLMPLHHTNGVNNQLVVPLLAGATMVLIPRFRAADAVEQLRTFRPTYVTGVPTMYNRMLPHVEASDSFPYLRFLRCGSAPITVAEHERIESAFGVPLVVSYGLSEATCTSTMNPPDDRRVGTVGTVLAGQRVALFHPDTDEEVPVGATGEIRISGPALMQGYLGTDVEQPVRNGWLRTGDLDTFDADGYLTITGRLKDVIIRGGENLSPAVIEGELVAHPAVRECCVVGRPDADLGEVPVAFVAFHGDQQPSEHELQELVHTRLSRVYAPAAVTVVDRLPTNGVGKVDRTALRRLALD